MAAIGDAKTCPHGHPINVGERIVGVPLGDVERGRERPRPALRERGRGPAALPQGLGHRAGPRGHRRPSWTTTTSPSTSAAGADRRSRAPSRRRSRSWRTRRRRRARRCPSCSCSPRTATAAEWDLARHPRRRCAAARRLRREQWRLRVERGGPGRLEERDDADQRSQQHRVPGGLRGPEGRRRDGEHQRRARGGRAGRHGCLDHPRRAANLAKAYGKAATAAPRVPTRLAGAPAMRFDYEAEGGQVRQLGALHGGHFYLVSFTASPSAWGARLQALDALLRSWRWE